MDIEGNAKKVLCSAEKSSVIWAEPHSRSSAKQFGQTERSVGHNCTEKNLGSGYSIFFQVHALENIRWYPQNNFPGYRLKGRISFFLAHDGNLVFLSQVIFDFFLLSASFLPSFLFVFVAFL